MTIASKIGFDQKCRFASKPIERAPNANKTPEQPGSLPHDSSYLFKEKFEVFSSNIHQEIVNASISQISQSGPDVSSFEVQQPHLDALALQQFHQLMSIQRA